MSDFLPTELDAGDPTTVMMKDSKGNIFLSPSATFGDGKSETDCPMCISSSLPCLEPTSENSLFSFTYNRVLRCTGFKVIVRFVYWQRGRKSVHYARIHDPLSHWCVCIYLHPLQFDFSIFEESVKPQFSAAGEKKFPLIQPTYEVSGVPDMFIGR